MSLRRFSEICRPPRKLSVNSADKTSCYFTRLAKIAQNATAFFNACQLISPALAPAAAGAAPDRRRAGLGRLRRLAFLSPPPRSPSAARRLQRAAPQRHRRSRQEPDGAAFRL